MDPRVDRLKAATPARRWLYAVKPGSWPKLFVPLVLGQSLGARFAGAFSWVGLVTGLLFTLGGVVFLVLVNDWADVEVDRIKRARFPDGCSPKAVADDIVPRHAALLVALGAALFSMAAATVGAVLLERPLLAACGAGGYALFVAYSLPPLRLNYRGGGELLEALGVGVALPWFNALTQTDAALRFHVPTLVGFSSLALASAIASGLSDEETDRQGHKRTFVTMFGNATGRFSIELLMVSGFILWPLFALERGGPELRAAFVAAVLGVLLLAGVFKTSASATTNQFAEQGRYKVHLHRAIWVPTLVLSGLLVFPRLVGG